MSADERLLDEAVSLVKAKITERWSVGDVVEHLASHRAFEDLDDDTLEALGAEVLKRARPFASRTSQTGGPARVSGRQGVGSTRPMPDNVSAPFRFVILPDDVAPRLGDGRHDLPIKGGLSATIDVVWAAETPLLVGEEKKEGGQSLVTPMRLGESGPYVIPGATWRGAIRSAVETVALGRIGGQANLHHRYGLRDFEHAHYVQTPVSRVGEVKAGWLEWPEGERKPWTIRPLGNGWAHVRIEDLQKALPKSFGSDLKSWNGRSLQSKYDAIGIAQNKTFDFRKTFRLGNPALDAQGRRVVPPAGDRDGVFVFANRLPGGGNKKHEYAFFGDGGNPVTLDERVVALFQRLYSKPSKNRPEPDGSWRDLVPTLRAGGRVPVFYVGDLDGQGGDFFFGLTRLFKIPHKHSVGDILKAQTAHRPATTEKDGVVIGYDADFVENLFGYVVERDALGLDPKARIASNLAGRKGRIAFGFTKLVNTGAEKQSDVVTLVLMAPRASFSPFYLRSNGQNGEKDYSVTPPARVAGRKRYLPRAGAGTRAEATLKQIAAMGQRQLERIAAASPGGKVSDDVKSHLKFLMPKAKEELRFQGEIRLHNVTPAELGAVLFALTHGGDPEKPGRFMIGRAKAFGAGQMRLVSAKLSVALNEKGDPEKLIERPAADEVVSDEGLRGFVPASLEGRETGENTRLNASHRPFLRAFTRFMREQCRITAYPNIAVVKEFIGASDPSETAKIENSLDYMELKAFNEVRKATKPLRPDKYQRPAIGRAERDGRLLPAPLSTRGWVSKSDFWK